MQLLQKARQQEQEVAGHIALQSRSIKKQILPWLLPLLPFYSVQAPSLWDGVTHLGQVFHSHCGDLFGNPLSRMLRAVFPRQSQIQPS